MKNQAQTVFDRLKKQYPEAHCALHHKNALQILVATILSAQCTDARVNMVTKDLFKKYKTVKDFAAADIKRFEQEIRSTGFYRNKAKNIILTAQKIVKEFNGKVPRSMEELVTLPGVARKTANIVLSNVYNIIAGIAVDTHVWRLSMRLGLSQWDDPNKIEKDLMDALSQEQWADMSHLLIDHGRAVCHARKPKCAGCILNDICPSRQNV